MVSETQDLVVVGGGPAGSNTALKTKERNHDLDITLFERGEQPSAQCAGGLGYLFYKHMGYRPPEEVIKAPVRNAVLASPDDEAWIEFEDVNIEDVDWMPNDADCVGWVLDRQAWDNWQLQKAEDEGVNVQRKHTVKSVTQKSNSVIVEVLDRESGELKEIETRYLALANGPNWGLAVEAGFDEDTVKPSKEELHMGCQYHMKDPEFIEEYGEDTIYLKFDDRYAPKGYVWSFPEGDGYTRWGNGVPLSEDSSASEHLNEFLEDTGKDEYLETKRQDTMAIIPTARPLDSCVKDNVALVGDVGHNCDPLHGGGMLFGARAGNDLAQAVVEDNIQAYDKYWKADFLDNINHRFIVKNMIFQMSNDEFNRVVEALDGFDFQSPNGDKEIPRMLWHMFKHDSALFTKQAAQATKEIARQKISF